MHLWNKKSQVSIVKEFTVYWRKADSKQITKYIWDATICVKNMSACVCMYLFAHRLSRRTHMVQWLLDG